jgi:hypothetical protein
MDESTAIKLLKEKYPKLVVDSIIDDGDRFIAQLVRRDGEEIFGGVKAVYKESKQVTDINPLRIKGLINRLMGGKN